MYLATTDWKPENVANRKRFFDALGFADKKIVAANLVHDIYIETVTTSSENFLLSTDGMVTKDENVVLTLTGADCFPVYFEEHEAGIVGLAHCGWRGIIGGIVTKILAEIVRLGGNAGSIAITIGPGICARHFEVKNDILDAFAAYPAFIFRDNGFQVDLKGIVRTQAVEAGISSGHIDDRNECTVCLPDKYFSYRRDRPEYLETQVAYITLHDK